MCYLTVAVRECDLSHQGLKQHLCIENKSELCMCFCTCMSAYANLRACVVTSKQGHGRGQTECEFKPGAMLT